MRWSFVRLTAGSVLLCWVVSFALLAAYSRSRSWTDERARTDGVFLAYEILDEEERQDRAARLHELRQHYWVPLALVSNEEVERSVGKSVHPGEHIPHRVSHREEWYFLVFADGSGALAAGPVDPVVPPGFMPIGVVLAILGLPLLAGLLAVAVDRSLRRVERASDALGRGNLRARVESGSGGATELAERFNAMAERVERLVKSRDELVQAVSHELGSPLSRLRFHLELLETEPEPRREERLHTMARELDTLDELVAELLSYIQSDDLATDIRAFEPGPLIVDLAELATLEAVETRPVEVELELREDADGVADVRLFQRAVENLLRNAVQHAGTRVVLELSQNGEGLHVTVHDDGPGIPEDLRDQVKLPFFRLESDRGRKTGGAGLGLAIVTRIVERHGGQLTIGASPLGGAAVRTSWPGPV